MNLPAVWFVLGLALAFAAEKPNIVFMYGCPEAVLEGVLPVGCTCTCRACHCFKLLLLVDCPHCTLCRLTDDLGYNAAWRNSDHKTPFINSLLAQGVTVDRNYVYRSVCTISATIRLPLTLAAQLLCAIPWCFSYRPLPLSSLSRREELCTLGYASWNSFELHYAASYA